MRIVRREFEVIKDTRFSDNPISDVITMSKQIEDDASEVAILRIFPTREVRFDDCISYRRLFRAELRKGYTLNDLYAKVNKTYAPFYKKV